MTGSVLEIYEFLKAHDFRIGLEYSTNISVNRGTKCLYCDRTEWQISNDIKYDQLVVNIIWKIDEKEWRSLELHGNYNTNFQFFKYSNGMLEITNNNTDIVITISGK